MITDARVLELARKFEQYPMSIEPTLRGPGVLEFARALLAEHVLPAGDSGVLEGTNRTTSGAIGQP